jgi:hypothetical protein
MYLKFIHFLKNKYLYLNLKNMGVGGTVLGSLAICLLIGLIIELKERHLN